MLAQPAQRDYRTWIIDSRRWRHYRPRATDIVIATYPKCGTTWMQRIVDLLVFQTPEPRPIIEISPWIDRRFPEPIEALTARLEAQDHPRFVKSHLPFDGLPIFEEVKYIHLTRDGRDACMSYHNHISAFTPDMLAELDRTGLADETVGRPYPRFAPDPAEYFRQWLTEGAVSGHHDGSPAVSFFRLERSWWDQRRRPNVLLVHYNDLKADLSGEMERVAAFLGVAVAADAWPRLIEAVGFEPMRRHGGMLIGGIAASFEGGSSRFFHRGTNQRWRGIFGDADLARYDAKVTAEFPPACARWVADGRMARGR